MPDVLDVTHSIRMDLGRMSRTVPWLPARPSKDALSAAALEISWPPVPRTRGAHAEPAGCRARSHGNPDPVRHDAVAREIAQRHRGEDAVARRGERGVDRADPLRQGR